MEDKATQISDRLLDYGATVIKICVKINKTAVGRHIGNQLLRAGTSVGANYEEACGAQSKADFIHKLQIALKEVRESLYWLKLIQRSNILEGEEIKKAINETQQVSAIIGRSIITAKKRK
ncbi:MAG TPA: four helix bundle protein [Desulfotomaculum sp.]|nr:four helix bundle protein [Desulfotomaculum sp.]